MILYARFEGIHAALIHSPCLTRSLMLDEWLARSSPCIIIITFSITLYCCLFFHKFSSLSRSDHVENNSFYAWCMKLSFYQVFIHPQRTPIEWVMPVLLRRCNLSKDDFRLHITRCFSHNSLYGSSNSSILDALEPALNEASDSHLFLPLNMSNQVAKIDENRDVCFWGSVTVMHGFAIPLGMTYLLLIYV
jgi:hypothetical protein